MGYSEALEQQMRWRDWLIGLHQDAHRESKPHSHPEDCRRITDGAEALAFGETYYWSPQICRVISAAGLPQEWVLDRTAVPTELGFAHFAGGLGWRFPPEIDAGPYGAIVLYAMTWKLTKVRPSGAPGVHIGALVGALGEDRIGWSSGIWEFGKSVGHLLTSDISGLEQRDAVLAVTATMAFGACMAFLEQRILIAPKQRAERHARKRLEAAGYTHEPLIRVVELRRKQTKNAANGSGDPVPWSCQWIVSGHWHHYWMNTEKGEKVLQPRWLMPYVKGPDDKPLRPPRAKVFAVVR